MRNEKELMALKKEELVSIAQEFDLPVSGNKEELTKRILVHQKERYDNETKRLENVLYHSQEEGEGLLVSTRTPEASDAKNESIGVDASDSSDRETKIETTTVAGDGSVVNHIVFTELPSRRFVAGGYTFKPYLATLAVVLLLMLSYGFQDYYRTNFSYPGDDKTKVDCIRVSYYADGNGNDSGYDPMSQASLECAEILDISPNWWQEEMDAWLQSILEGTTSGDTNSSGFVWSQSGIDIVTYYGATYFNVNMSIYGYPSAGDEFTEEHLAIWNGFGAGVGAGNDSLVDLLPGGAAPYNIPNGIVDHAPTGYVWLQSGIDIVSYYGSTFFNVNMSVYGNPSAGDVFTENDLALWNGFGAGVGAGNDTFDDLLAGGSAPFNIPAGIVEFAPSGYHWLQSGIDIVSYYGATFFNVNMSVYDDPSAGDVFTQNHLALWNSFGAGVGAGNDTFVDLLPGGTAPFNIPAGIILTSFELMNQTPLVSNVTLAVDNLTEPSVYSFNYVFFDAQNGTDNSTVEWFVNGTYVANTNTYSANLTNGSTIMCIVTPYDDMYWGVPVQSDTLLIAVENEA